MDVGRLLQAQERFLAYMAGGGSIAGVPASEGEQGRSSILLKVREQKANESTA